MSQYEHWKSKIKPMAGKVVTLPFMVHFIEEEVARAKRGLLPESMDEKWIGFWSEEEVGFYRSWTGHQIYRLPVVPHGIGYNVGPLEVVDDSGVYRRSSDTMDQDMAGRLLSKLTGRAEPNQKSTAQRP